MPRRRLTLLRSVLLAALALPSCGRDKDKSKNSASEEEPAPYADVPLCNAAKDETRSMAFVRALQGDVFVLRYALEFKDHAEVRSAMKGATKSETFIVFEGWVDGPSSGSRVVVDGSEDPAKSAPYVVRGSMDGMGRGDVALPDKLARTLGVDVGAMVRLYRAGPSFGTSPVKARDFRVAAILEYPGHAITGFSDRFAIMTLAAARSVTPDENVVDEVTGVRAWYPEPDVEPAAEELRKGLATDKYRVLTHKEMHEGTRMMFEDARAACARGLPPAPAAVVEAKQEKLCSMQGRVEESGLTLRTLGGDYYIAGEDIGVITAAVAKTSPGDTATRIGAEASFATHARISWGGLIGIEDKRLGLLAERVLRGDLTAVDDGEGVAISDDLATLLQVDVGSEILVRLRPLPAAPSTAPLGIGSMLDKLAQRGAWSTLKVSAVLTFPASRIASYHEGVAWASQKLVRKLDGPKEYVVVWDTADAPKPFEPSPFALSFRKEMDAAKLTPTPGYDAYTFRELARFVAEACPVQPVP